MLSFFDCVPSRLLDFGVFGIRDTDFHGPALQPLASEVEGIDVDGPVPPLHDSGDELLGMERSIASRQNVPHGPEIAVREPRHPSRVHVQLPEPADPRRGAPQSTVDFVRVVLISGIMGGLIRGPTAGTRDREHYVRRVRCSFERRSEKRHAGLKAARSLGHRAHDLIEHMLGNNERSHFSSLRPIEFGYVLHGEHERLGKRIFSGIPDMSLSLVAQAVIADPMVPLRMRIHVHAGLLFGVIGNPRPDRDLIRNPRARADEASVKAGFHARHGKRLELREYASHEFYFCLPPWSFEHSLFSSLLSKGKWGGVRSRDAPRLPP